MRICLSLLSIVVTLAAIERPLCAADVTIAVDSPMPPPAWAVMERELIRANAQACREFFAKYFDERGYLLCVERWGGDDGPDDAIENVADWPILHALGAPDDVLEMYKTAWEGHLRQYSEAKTVEVPFARDGMYYKEFPCMMDWMHNGEGLRVFNLQGLSDPNDVAFGHRVRRFAGFYMNEDPGAPNYDPRHKIIRSLFNGSRGPLMRQATGLDWAGDPIEVENRFHLGHGERNYAEMVAHFKDYNDILGDHPQNLSATTLAANAYMLTGEQKYRNWLLEYVDAWLERLHANDGIIPSNIGLDGTIGGATDGKWYGGVYGWGFSVEVPQTGEIAHRSRVDRGVIGFGNAYLLTGDRRYVDAWTEHARSREFPHQDDRRSDRCIPGCTATKVGTPTNRLPGPGGHSSVTSGRVINRTDHVSAATSGSSIWTGMIPSFPSGHSRRTSRRFGGRLPVCERTPPRPTRDWRMIR